VVEYFLRLKLRLLANSFRRNPWQLVGMIFALFYGLGTAIILVAGLIALRFVDIELARSSEVVFGSAIVVVFTVLPLVLGIDDTLDPRRFSLFGMSNNRLSIGLGLAALISVPALVITVVALALIFTWGRDPLSFSLSVLSALVIIVTCLLSARVTTSIASFLLSTRRARDISGLIGLVLLVCLAPGVAALASVDWEHDATAVLTSIERVIGWTPLGAAWAAPADAAAGDSTGALWKILIAIAWVLVLALCWRLLVGRMLISPERQATARRYVGLGWFDRLPAKPVGAIAARNLTYWGRDARYGTSLAVIPLIPAIMIIALHIGGVPLQQLALLPVPVMCLFLSWAVHNDVSFDNTAVWLHLAASTSGRADRWGRLIPVLLVGVPIIVIGSILSAWAFGDWSVLPAIAGVSACILFSGLGLSSVMSAAFPYPTVRPGDSPFAQPHGGGSPAGLIQAMSFGAIIIFAALPAVFATLGLLGSPEWNIWSLISGVAIGVSVLLAGVAIGSRVYDRRGPDLLAFSLRN
jgi:ABC-2 type transport system permease protein